MPARVFNFSPGPATLPYQVLQQAAKDIVNFGDTGISLIEMSHRSKEFIAVADQTEALLRELMGIPSNYKVLFLQGGASSQFFMIPMNLLAPGKKATYLNTGTWMIAKKRIGWLLLLFLTGSLTGTVMRMFEAELAAVVALAYFIPLLIGTGGNAGSQTTSTIIRALAVGDMDVSDGLVSLWHELRVGLILGLGMSGFAFIRAITWGTTPQLAFAVAFSIIAIVIWANASGAVLPLLAARLKIDPTVVSGPVMSTLVDATGLFIYFTIAKSVIGV